MYGVSKRSFFRFPGEIVIFQYFDKSYLPERRIVARITTVTNSRNAIDT